MFKVEGGAHHVPVREPVGTPERQLYAAGFMIGPRGRVWLVRKNRPAWQAGLLNAIGGHVELGEAPAEAMRREFAEEGGVDVGGWEHFATLRFGGGDVWFYRLHVDEETFGRVHQCTDEPLEVVDGTADALDRGVVANLAWLMPLALYDRDRYAPLYVEELHA